MQGGIKAVIWTDVFQAGCIILGMLAILIQVCNTCIVNLNLQICQSNMTANGRPHHT